MKIIPAILTDNPEEIKQKISQVEGLFDRVQIDIIDGEFANNRAGGLEALSFIETSLVIDIHLMTKEPSDWVEKSVRAQADRIIGQVEKMSDQFEFVAKVQEVGLSVGLALDLETQVETLEKEVLRDLDVILIMAVSAGFQGQEFNKTALDKVKTLAEIRRVQDCRYKICVDGGVEAGNVKEISDAGADEVVAGSSLFEGNLDENINNFMEALR